MGKYIDKDVLVAWIKGRMDENSGKQTLPQYFGMVEEDLNILSFIDTLEVKGVDLEKEIVDGWKTIHNAGNDIPFDTFNGIATHFFERGMRFSAVGSDYIEGVRGYCETTTK